MQAPQNAHKCVFYPPILYHNPSKKTKEYDI